MKNNTMKRALALTLSVLTVAAPMTANVEGVLQEVAIVASAAYDAADPYNGEFSGYIQANGLLRFDEDSVAFVEGLYEITVDAGKYVYTKVSGTDVYTLKEGKAYVLRTKAYMTEDGLEYADEDQDLNDEDLPAGVYEYKIFTVQAAETLNVTTMKNNIKVNQQDFAEGITVTQNGNEIKYDADEAAYIVAQGFPVEITAKPGEVHTLQMLAVDANAAVKGQTKASGSVTLTVVPTRFPDESETVLSWADYEPTLQLINDKGTIRATDVGFNSLISNAVVGNYEFKYGKYNANNTTFTAAETNAKGQYVADGESRAYVTFKAKTVTIDNKTYSFFDDIDGANKVEFKKADGTWASNDGNGHEYDLDDTKDPGTWRVTTLIDHDMIENATLSEDPFKIVTEFTVAGEAVTGTKNLVFVAPNDNGEGLQRIQPANGVYNVPWQNGEEVKPNLILYRNAADAAAVTTQTVGDAATAEENAIYGQNGDDTFFMEGKDYDYTVTGTTTASEAGTYTMTITPTSKSKFNDGEEITITWQIVNTNNYVTAKKTPTCLSDKTPANDSEADDAVKSAKANAQNFNIGYRQANSKSIVEKITKSLDFVGSTELTIVEYRKVEWNAEASQADGGKYKAAIVGNYREGDVVEDPSEKAGFYVAFVANSLKNDGKTSAMMKDNTVYNDGELYPVFFQVTPTRVRIVPDVTEITYGDKVDLSKLYTIIDADTKETIKVPWAANSAPKFTLKDKYSEKVLTDGATKTETLAAGEYVYGIADGVAVLDAVNYDVKELIAEDQTDFTVNPRDLDDMQFGTVRVPVPAGENVKNVTVTKNRLALAANLIEANPVEFSFKRVAEGQQNAGEFANANGDTLNLGDDVTERNYEELVANAVLLGTNFNISGGTTSAKVTDLGKMLTVTIKGVGNFTGTKKITWVVGDNVLNDEVLTYEAEFDAAKPRVMAKFNTKKVDGEIEECGFYYCNNGKMNDVEIDTDAQQAAAKELFKQVDATGENMNQKGAKKVIFTNKAVTTALSGNGLLTAEIANSSVLKQVYIMPYVKYTNGNIAYGKVDKFNYYDMVLNAEGALEMTKTDFVGDGKIGTAGNTYVKVDVTRVDKKGYEVERYGILYNNSDSWNDDDYNKVPLAKAGQDQAKTFATVDEMVNAYQWLNIDYESEKTVKVAEIPEEDLATKIGTNTYILNTTAKKFDDKGKVLKDYGYGAKTVFARAFIQIKDAAGNTKVYYSHLADVTYGGFTVDTVTGVVKGTEWADAGQTTAVTDSKNTSQILFYAPTSADFNVEDLADVANYDEAAYDAEKDGVKILEDVTEDNMTRMNASTGNKTFQVWWTDQKKS